MTYYEQLKHPLWQQKRLQIFERDKFKCQICLDTETELQVHHKVYDRTYKTMAWEYKDYTYQTLCKDCHAEITIHLALYGTANEFDVIKLYDNGKKYIFVYSKGKVKINGQPPIDIPENIAMKLTQFLIDNLINKNA